MGRKVHIMTVGTSLLTNDGELNSRNKKNNNYYKVESLNKECSSALDSLNAKNQNPLSAKENIIKVLKDIDPEHEISLREHANRDKGSDRLPQELSYLWIRKKDKLTTPPSPPEEIYLLPPLSSHTPHARFCAEVIKEYLETYNDLKDYYTVKGICPVEGIDPYDGEKFREAGIKNLFEAIHSLMELYDEDDRIYLNITGGYKGLVPYSTIQGMLYPKENVTICYLFEDSPEIIEIPVYPVGVDFHLWHRNSTRLKMICEYGIEEFRDNLDNKISNLLDKNQLDTLGIQLRERYNQQLEQQPLEIYTKEIVKILLPDCLGGNVSKYREILNNLIDRAGENIWTGDKIPEMVEHAKRHHHNLLVFAEMFLTPIFKVNSDFLNAEERFCLIAGILLHDCGHSLDYMRTDRYGIVPLFPGEIREYHHLLSAMRLDDPELAEKPGWPRRDGLKSNGLNGGLHDAVLTVCRYHRKRMPFNQGEEPFKNPFTEEEFPPLIECKKNFNGMNIDIMKVVALMRIIDGCDNQATRLGSPETVEITTTLLKRDYESARERAFEAIEGYKFMCRLIKDPSPLKAGCNYIDEGNMKLEDYTGFRIDCLETLKNSSSKEDDKTLARLWLTTAELIDRADMKHKQEEHYIKHQCVREVLVLPADGFKDNNLCFDIVLVKNGEIADEYMGRQNSRGETYREMIEGEVASEYCGIERYLSSELKLRLKYWWKEEFDRRGNGGKPFYEYHG